MSGRILVFSPIATTRLPSATWSVGAVPHEDTLFDMANVGESPFHVI
jgi:hypothetical protein